MEPSVNEFDCSHDPCSCLFYSCCLLTWCYGWCPMKCAHIPFIKENTVNLLFVRAVPPNTSQRAKVVANAAHEWSWGGIKVSV